VKATTDWVRLGLLWVRIINTVKSSPKERPGVVQIIDLDTLWIFFCGVETIAEICGAPNCDQMYIHGCLQKVRGGTVYRKDKQP
jgi:hypothetical protein